MPHASSSLPSSHPPCVPCIIYIIYDSVLCPQDLDEDGDSLLSKDELLDALTDPEVQKKREQDLFAQFQASVNYGLLRYQVGRSKGVDRKGVVSGRLIMGGDIHRVQVQGTL